MPWNTYTAAGSLKTAAASVGYGTSLPASPVDGQEYILVDSTSAPTYRWRLRYNNGSGSSYKWEYVGGTPRTDFVNASESTASAAFVNLTTVAPTFTVPRAGEYEIFLKFLAVSATISSLVKANVHINGSPGAIEGDTSISTANYFSTGIDKNVVTLAASDVLLVKYATASAATTNFQSRVMTVTPIRVS